jgi:uncharacterized protein DUF5681
MPKKRSNSPSANYEVGYGRPPKQYEFKPGQIANPEGINRKPVRSPDFKASLERELKKPMKIQKGKQTLTVTQAAAGIGELVSQFAKGDHRARRDLVLLCEKLGVDLTNRAALQGALEDALSAEDEALLADFVKRYGGQYPIRTDAVSGLPAKDQNLLSPSADDPKLLMARRENSTSPANEPIKGDVR